MHRVIMGTITFGVALTLSTAGAHAQEPTATEGWVRLPEEGATSASAFAVINNPGMYAVYLVSASSEVAGKVEFRRGGDGEPEAVRELTVPAYGKLTLRPDGAHVALLDLERPLEEDETISITLTTDGNVEILVKAAVRKE